MIDYLPAILGGALIGLAACLMMYLFGQIMGISGIITRLIKASEGERSNSMLFLSGTIIGALMLSITADLKPPPLNSNMLLIIASGVLVGFGTRMGSGCTSGHGICGISRFSIRSVIATLVFMASGAGIATLGGLVL